MIHGIVNNNREVILKLRVRGPGGVEMDFDAVIDSGFSASLTLPAAAIAALGLVRQSNSWAVLADGSVRHFGLFGAEVEWDGSWRTVLVSGVGDDVLVGMGLLADHELRVAVRPGGAVEVVAIL